MTQQFFTVTLKPRRKRRRVIRPEMVGLLFAAVLAVLCIIVTLLLMDNRASAVEVVDPEPTYTPQQEEELISFMPEEAHEDDWLYYQAQIPAADPADITRLAQTVWGEARGVTSKAEQAAVIWCVFNRIDDPCWEDTIEEVCIASQFHGYDPDNPVEPELYDLALDVYARYYREKAGDGASGRTLPKEYVYFHGDGNVNHFRIEYESTGEFWDWSLPSPYAEDYE